MTDRPDHIWAECPNHPFYTCTRCHISGKAIGSAWPPIRDPKYIDPKYRFCDEEAADARFWDELERKHGVTKP